MAVTPRLALPTPDLPDAPNIPFDMSALAVATENHMAPHQVSGALTPGTYAAFATIPCGAATSTVGTALTVSAGAIVLGKAGVYTVDWIGYYDAIAAGVRCSISAFLKHGGTDVENTDSSTVYTPSGTASGSATIIVPGTGRTVLFASISSPGSVVLTSGKYRVTYTGPWG